VNEDRFKSSRLVEPSSQLKERVKNAALAAWYETPEDVAWWIPIRRLGIAVAAAVVMVSCANYASDQAGMRWQIADEIDAGEFVSDPDEMGDATDMALVRHLTVTLRPIDMAAVREYQEQVRQMLDEQG
jgi:hypothetical protein